MASGFHLGGNSGDNRVGLPISGEGINTLIVLQFFQKPLSEAIQILLWLHSGALLAALICFRRDIIGLFRHVPRHLREFRTSRVSERGRLISFLGVATIVSGALGAPLLLYRLRFMEAMLAP